MIDLLTSTFFLSCIVSFLFGMGTQKFIAVENKGNALEENGINPNELVVKFLIDSNKKFTGLEFIQNGEFYFRAKAEGEDANDAVKKIIDGLSDVSSKIELAHNLETQKSLK